MRLNPSFVSLAAALCYAALAIAQDEKERGGYPPNLPDAKVETYKIVGDVKLNLYGYYPEGHKATDKRPAIVFFFGGGWTTGTPEKFAPQCRYLASRGIVAMTADYRVASRHHVKAASCVADAKSAIRFVRKEADRLGIDSARIVAAGGSAGGHIAACTGLVQGFDESAEDAQISSVPNAMALFNPVVVLTPVDSLGDANPKANRFSEARVGADPKALSPYHQVHKSAPPTIIFSGKADTTVPFVTVELFTKAMRDAGNHCTLLGYDGQGHGFFNYRRGDDEYYRQTLKALDAFLVERGYLAGPDTVDRKP